MKNILLFIFIISIIVSCKPKIDVPEPDKQIENKDATTFEEVLAKKYGADDYGMKSYIMAFLRRGPNRDGTKAELDSLQRLHLNNIGKMVEEGKLVLAGPFLESEFDIRGIYIFNTSSLDSATIWTQSDPAIQKGSLEMELHPWYGSAALMNVNELHTRLAKTNI